MVDRIAFFDLDRTLLEPNSAQLWVRYEVRHGRMSRWHALRAATWLLRYHLGYANLHRAIEAGIATLAGQAETVVLERTRHFYETELRHRVRPGAHARIRAHRARGDRLVLLTSSSRYLSELAGTELGLDDVICTRFEVDANGSFTGRAIDPLCYGDGKRVLAAAYALRYGLSLSRCTFYTDSAADLPALEAMGTPVAVNPDPKLRKIALRKGWAIEHWGSSVQPQVGDLDTSYM